MQKLIQFFDRDTRENFLIRLFSAWSIMGIANYLTVSGSVEKIESVKNTSFIFSVILFIASYALITLLSIVFRKIDIDGITLAASSLLYSG